MTVHTGGSSAQTGREAVIEATASFPEQPDLILVFHSSRQDGRQVAEAIASRFPGVPVAGCTTAGEHVDGVHSTGRLVACAIKDPSVRWSVHSVKSLRDLDATAAADQLLNGLALSREDLDPKKHFCLALLDGLSGQEEQVAARMAEALEGIPLIGGSAGDDLKFKATQVIGNLEVHDQGGVFVLGESALGFEVIKHQHFVSTSRTLVVTRVEEATRRVFELDGLPAAQAYAKAMGLERSELTDAVCFENPLLFQCNGEMYVRSIRCIEADDSLSFYCALEEGMVLTIGGHREIDDALEEVPRARTGQAELLIASNCILRSLEATAGKKHELLGQSMTGIARHVIGFDTYGEQLNGLHINQTLVGLALGRAS